MAVTAAESSYAPAATPVLAVPSATGIDARLVLAGPGARALAFVLDWMIRGCVALAWWLVATWLITGSLELDISRDQETAWTLLAVVPATAIYFLYHPVLEPLMGGRTPGKRMTGLRILTPEGHVPTLGALLTRNVFRIVDGLPGFYVVGLLFLMFGSQHRRLGDLAAGTVVALERAPFLEKLAQSSGANTGPWEEVRRRAQALGRRHGDVDDALSLVDEYRLAARTLGASRRQADAADTEYLEATYADLHDVIHRPARRLWRVLWSVLRDRVPAAVHTMRVHLLAVSLLFVISAVSGFWLVNTYPDLIEMFASQQLIATVERGELWTDNMLNVAPSAVLSVDILTNNIMVSIFAFCSGIIFGLGTFYIVGINGVSLGAIFALTGQHGLAGRLFDFVVAHGCVELSCICISGAAGSLLGEALIRPGTLSRGEAFRRAAREGLSVMFAVTLLLLVCGFIEGYVSPDPEIPRWARVTIGVAYWLFMISLLRGHVFGRSRGGAAVNA
ncbi:MAG TPA: stage II sporulation protein M [Steroidobacteraceae bacterium]|jgi:uncharacterized membrane protein SpoIIM required for sporulation/uncharacterized RDD family membrane protein YckC|nr:stage II sporulation protein M [Steroidobacteraceae bacterium]